MENKLILFDKGKFIESRWIHFKRGLLQGDSLTPIAFCLNEIPVGILINETKGYKMGLPGERIEKKNTQSIY